MRKSFQVSDFLLKCKKTGIKFTDLENTSGKITIHIQKEYPNFVIESSFKRRQFETRTGKKWYAHFFDLVENKNKREVKKCEYCDWDTVDLDNSTGAYTVHLQNVHGITIDQYSNEFPAESILFATHFDKKEKKNKIESHEDNYVVCEECGEKFSYLTATHLQKHGMTPFQYKMKYPKSNYASKDFVGKTTKHLNHARTKITKSWSSKGEIQVREFLAQFYPDTIGNDRKLLGGTEIDILSHKYKIGIEYNGCYYHTEQFKKGSDFHIKRTLLMNNKGYGLLQIFEDEWTLKPDITASKICETLNIFPENFKNMPAQLCKIEEISVEDKDEFLKNNDVFDLVDSEFNFGAFFNKRLVAIICVDKIENNEFKIQRICRKIETNISTDIYKILIDYIITALNPSKLSIHADVRWTPRQKSNMYLDLGFTFKKIVEPDYYYVNKNINKFERIDKNVFSTKLIQEMAGDNYDENKPEEDTMDELGYKKLYNCGYYLYEMKFF